MDNIGDHEHRLILTNREQLEIQGVLHINSFDDSQIILESDLGMLSVEGEELHIKQLDLDAGHLEIEGIIKAIDYLEDLGPDGVTKKGRGIIARIFK